MDNFQKSSKNMFVAQGLERLHDRRKDPDWIDRRMRDPASFFVAVWKSKILVTEGEAPSPVLLKRKQLEGHAEENFVFFLGEKNGNSYFAVDIGEEVPGAFNTPGRFRDLRAVAPLLSREDGALLAYAKTLVYWHKRNYFCGACGSRNEMRDGGHCRTCVNPQCGVVHFPRTDPAIIVMIRSGEKCLLGRQSIWPEHMYSVVAGFVEPGESAEGAVAREVFEEVGLRVKNIRYHSSQPWPFPCSLMLGFTADTEDEHITLGDKELEDARWFERRELQKAVENGVVKLSTPISISYRLIEDWFDSESPFRLRDFAGRGFVVRKEE
ncbi:MAG: NAD(+) diphosphatase [Syntrophobacteraceae bacterium]